MLGLSRWKIGAPLNSLWILKCGVRYARNYPERQIVENKAIRNKYEVTKEIMVGIVLEPSEVKSVRMHNCDISSAYAEEYKGELFLHQMYIPGECVFVIWHERHCWY